MGNEPNAVRHLWTKCRAQAIATQEFAARPNTPLLIGDSAHALGRATHHAALRQFVDQGFGAACTNLVQALLALWSAVIPKPTPQLSSAGPLERPSLRSEPRELAPGHAGLIELDEHSSDTDLARALLFGRPEAAILVRKRFGPLIRGMVRRALGATADNEDIEQDVFLHLFSSVYGLRQPGAFRAFVITTTKRTIGHAIRRRQARAHLAIEVEQPARELIGDVGDPAAHHALIHLHQLLERLRERERRAFILRFVLRLEAEEIAEILGTSLPTARRAFERAFRRVVVWASRNPFLSEYLSADVLERQRSGAAPDEAG